jgi:hypothetical protein
MLENFKVLEVIKSVEPACVIIDDKHLRFTKPVVSLLDFAPFAKILMDDQGKRIAIQVARGNEANTINFSKSKDEQKSSVMFQNAVMVSLIRGIMPEWKPGEKYSIAGQFSKEDKAVIFDLKTAKPYWRRDPKAAAQ